MFVWSHLVEGSTQECNFLDQYFPFFLHNSLGTGIYFNISTVDAKAAAAEGCANSLPVGRTKVIHALEGVSGKLDIIPHGFGHLMAEVNKGCQKVEGVLGKLHLLRRRRGLPSLSKVNRKHMDLH